MQSKIILALDLGSLDEAKYFIHKLYPKVKIFKVGLQLYTAAGPKIIQTIHQKGGEVFLDLKFFDIPNTVAQAIREAVRQRIKMLTLHILGGEAMLKAAVKAAKSESERRKVKKPLLLGVTILTSQKTHPNQVLKLAKIGINSGLDGVVCSAREARALRSKIKRKFLIVTPGIRPKGVKKNDQKRTATVKEAVQAGSNFLVVGRPILEANDPLKALQLLE
ncbi:MAG: orotidine-5'-phosphate decarboxylase [Candidatus Omnitrophota bacterium]